jgi:choline dehydrogenase-like flavoprotein
MNHVDGRQIHAPHRASADVVVIGSGPAGSAVAREATRRGAKVTVLEAGPWLHPADFAPSAFDSMAASYRDLGASVVLGSALMPYVQGRMVGGSSPINGAICWRLPRDVYDGWVDDDPALADALPWSNIVGAMDEVEGRLNVAPTDPSIAGRKNRLMAEGATALGIEHRPIRRNVRGCRGRGLCMQGCPEGAKESADRSLLTDALEGGATLLSSTQVRRIERDHVLATTPHNTSVRIDAGRIVLAASAIQSPLLLLDSGLHHGPVGRNFMCHPGVSVAGRFDEPVRMWDGATQGHEVIGLRSEGLKFEALGFGPGLLAARLPGVGSELRARIDELHHWLDWGVAVRARARGRVRKILGRTVVRYSPTKEDVAAFARGSKVLSQLLLAAGATAVAPGFKPGQTHTSADSVAAAAPTRASGYLGAITHMFGTCRMGSDPATSVVRPDFRHHTRDGLYIADSSVFPTNTGVNPQIAIMALATLCAREVAA